MASSASAQAFVPEGSWVAAGPPSSAAVTAVPSAQIIAMNLNGCMLVLLYGQNAVIWRALGWMANLEPYLPITGGAHFSALHHIDCTLAKTFQSSLRDWELRYGCS